MAIAMTCNITTHGRTAGHRPVQAASMVRSGLRVPRAQILHVQAAHDPHERLGESILPRQRYSETKGMIVWHIDSEASASDGKGIFCLACAMILHPRWLTGLPRDLNECIYDIYGITSICRAINQQFHALNLNPSWSMPA